MTDIREQIERLRRSVYLLNEHCIEASASDCANTMEKLLAVVEAVKYHKELMPKGVMKALAALEDSDDSNEGL
jgi:hypothetical protein